MAGADPYAGKSDFQVLKMAQRALERASALSPGSVERAIQWSVFDGHMAELDRRAIRHVLASIKEQDEEQDGR